MKYAEIHNSISAIIQSKPILIPAGENTGYICALDSNNLALDIMEYLSRVGMLK